MQLLWARLLAGEVTTPGSFSLRTLNTLRLMKQENASVFDLFSNFVWDIGGSTMALGSQAAGKIDGPVEYPYGLLLQLDALGLIQISPTLIGPKEQPILVAQGGKAYSLSFEQGFLSFWGYSLTDIGAELMRLCNAQLYQELHRFWIDKWVGLAWKVEEV